MNKKYLLITLFAVLCLINGIFCFCCSEVFAGNGGINLSACPDWPGGSSPESPLEQCGFCCGHQVFTAEAPMEISDLPQQKSVVIEGLTFFTLFSSRSIYHPPRA